MARWPEEKLALGLAVTGVGSSVWRVKYEMNRRVRRVKRDEEDVINNEW